MSWSAYLSFVALAGLLVLVPGADFAVVVRNTLAGGAPRGRWSATGVACSTAVQGLAAVAGLGAAIVRAQPLFQVIRWAGIGYLLFLAVQAFAAARAGRYRSLPADAAPAGPAVRLAGWRQGFLSNITNPKVLVFYLALLPQFLGGGTPWFLVPLFALTHAALSLAYLLLVAVGLGRVRAVLLRRRVRRALDVATGAVLLAFGARLAAEGT